MATHLRSSKPSNKISTNCLIFKCIYLLLFFFILPYRANSQNFVNSEWITEFEASGFNASPDYKSTMDYFKKIASYSELARMFSFGQSPQGRDINCIIVNRDKQFSLDEVKTSGKPVVLFLSGIHSGEINGKDASMLLLREILVTREKSDLIKNVVLLVIPIFSVDAHERRSPYNRINQIGPEEMGWRVTAQNYNLNRDFMKADAPEMRAFLKLYSNWLPDFFVDIHSTDGIDHQYQTTITIEHKQNTRSVISDWIKSEFYPFIFKRVQDRGFSISPYVGIVDGDPKKGIRDWLATPRFSNGYAAVQNRPGLLIESHIRKPYKERVYSTLAVLESTLELINSDPNKVVEMNKKADEEGMSLYASGRNEYPLDFERLDDSTHFRYKGIEYKMKYSSVAGGEVKVYTGKKFEEEVPYYKNFKITKSVKLPRAYIVPQEWYDLIDIMKLHGVKVQKIDDDVRYIVEKYKFSNVSFADRPYEGRFIPNYDMKLFVDTADVRKGSFLIETNQRTFGIITYLLQPESNESFVKWGTMNQIFERKEYFEDYAMLPIAGEMYKNDPAIREEFNGKIKSDEHLRNSVTERLFFFYERSPYYDARYNIYPVMRVVEKFEK